MKVFVFSALGLLLLAFLIAWLVTRIRYEITPRHVRVRLFALTLRRIRLDRLDSVSKRRGPGLMERWPSTMRTKHRALVLRKKSGLFKNVLLTPRNRYAFKFELERLLAERDNPTAAPSNQGQIFED